MDPDDYEMDWFEGAEDDRANSMSFLEDALRQITFQHLKAPIILFILYTILVGIVSAYFYKLTEQKRRERNKTKRQRRSDRKADAVRRFGEGPPGAATGDDAQARTRLRKLWTSVKRKKTLAPYAQFYAKSS